ncbi:MAG: XRE family transcriptional regulator [bacterium]|nr:XRE family transcriptional regulator [bacterium]
MNELESDLKSLILKRYGSLKNFADTIHMPWTTLDSILKRGVANSNISNVLKITKALGINAEKLVDGQIVQKSVDNPYTLAAHFDGDEYTATELEDIKAYAEFVKNRRNRNC